ncbi:Phage tail protein [Paenibacillus sp. UNCCL117]|uniref:phage tail domain-containing protein n=1 Tax=unclassified Paenibacillus TaxID=185978 RepID=UPI00088DA4A2|nr:MULTISPECIES: phage tail domain-containing protein [unclassified Paenibacillus]SDD26855.1 Phage tail protein [Paenibacillus sp. cl123]SFW40652.1 Phage tail protein [Paenibacillus sp. UNCCL117]
MSVKTLAGKTPREMGMIVLRGSQRSGLPSTRDKSVAIPGKNGELDYGADMHPRLFVLECAFAARNSLELQLRIEGLARLMVDSYGRPRTVELVFNAHPDRSYSVRYSGAFTIERIAGLGKFSLPLTAYEPYSHGLEQLWEQTVVTSPRTFTINSEGDIRTEPVIELTNTGSTTITNFRIQNEYEIDQG